MTTAKGAYLDKSHKPSEAEIMVGLGSRRGLWEELIAFVEGNYRVAKDLIFYGKSYGWAVRFRKGSRALISLYPGLGAFTAQIVVGEGQLVEALASGLGEGARRMIEAAKPYPEGRWLFIPIDSEDDLLDVERLLATKSPPKNRQGDPCG
jgi:hypothetical protein